MKSEIVVAIGAALVGGAYLWGVAAIPRAALSDPLGPGAFPTLLGIILLIGAGVQALEILLKRRAVAAAPDAPAKSDASSPIDPSVGGGIVALVAFAVLLEPLGFVVAMSLLMATLSLLLDRRRWRLNIAVSVGFAVAIYLLFAKILGVTLPRGILPL